MRAIPKTAKIHPAAKKCCGWEKPAICKQGSNQAYGETLLLWSVKLVKNQIIFVPFFQAKYCNI